MKSFAVIDASIIAHKRHVVAEFEVAECPSYRRCNRSIKQLYISAAYKLAQSGGYPVRISFRLLMTLAALPLAACGGGGKSEEGSGEASSGGESDYAGPIASTDVAHGKETFDSFCGDCHPDGGSDVGPSLIESPHTPAQLRQQVREGSGKMRPFSEGRLGKDDLESVLAYLASINAVK